MNSQFTCGIDERKKIPSEGFKRATVTVAGDTAINTPDPANPPAGQIFKSTVSLPVGPNTVTITSVGSGSPASITPSLVVIGGVAKVFIYDPNGNCDNVNLTGTNIAYEWDAADRLAAVDTYVSNTATLYRSEFTYDGYGRRVQIVEKTNGTVTGTKRFVWMGARLCEERDDGNSVTRRFFANGEQIGGTNYYFTKDHLGSIREMTDSAGTVRARYGYDSYGVHTKVAGDMEADFGYAGYYVHAPSGLYMTLYRAYDADTGRWLNQDPIQEAGGLNLYAYVANNPINFIDPYGLWTFEAYGGVGWGAYLSFGYNSGHFSFRIGTGAGGGASFSFDPKNSPLNIKPNSNEGGVLAKLDIGNGPIGFGLEGVAGGSRDNCDHTKEFAHFGINGSAVIYGGSLFGYVAENQGDEGWKGQMEDPNWQLNIPDPFNKEGQDLWKGNWGPKERESVGGFVGVYFGHTF